MVSARTEHGWERRYRTRMWRIDRLPDVPFILVPVPYVAIDPVLLLWTLRYYTHTPEARHELGTDAALARIHEGAVLLPE